MSAEHDCEMLLEAEEGLLQQQQRSRPQRFALPAVLALALVALVATHPWTSTRDGSAEQRIGRDQVKLAIIQGAAEASGNQSCSWKGQNCATTKCCGDAGFQCFEKDSSWSECRSECTPGRDPTSADEGEWTCEKLGSPAPGEVVACSTQGEDCTKTQCCADAGMQCYEKIAHGWAACKPTCTKGLDLADVDPNPWTCKELGGRTPDVAPWVYEKCAGDGADCAEAGCCATPGQQCFLHDQYYGECMESCDTDGWDCEPKGYRTPIPAPPPSDGSAPLADWVASKCSKSGENCLDTSCCTDGGNQCFAKNSTFASCKASCSPGPDLYDEDSKDWSCKALGPQTPGIGSEPWEMRKELSSWVAENCSEQYSESCTKSKCCKNVGDQCFEKDKEWATCMPACTPGPMEGDESGGNWSCNPIGPVTHRAYPSLFCFHVLRPPPNYEPEVVAASMGTGAGVFACDQYALFSSDKFTLGEGEFATETVTFEPAEVGESKDGTAANAELFMNVWTAVKNDGKYSQADWTIKLDPDAVLLPNRLRKHLDAFTGQSGYIVNCAKPYMPEGPMMFGALEAISKLAMDSYYEKEEDCRNGLPWQEWGEDLYMGKCLEKIGVDRLNDWNIYSDGVCRGVDCGDPDAAAFHPMKDVGAWMECLEQTKNPHESSGDLDADAPEWFKEYMASYAR